MLGATPRLSVVIPARNAAASLVTCVAAVHRSAQGLAEIIVVDDGSTDGTGDLARSLRATVIRQDSTTGPAGARNAGARVAAAPILLFVDADVSIAEDAIGRVLQAFSDEPDRAAVFGSYDAAPASRAFVSDYRNLLHHFVHQSSRQESASFWAGCGAVRTPVFLALEGFDERYRRASIEDIEFGGRLARSGHSIRLDKDLHCTHLKKWTLGSLVVADIRDRAYPWARLILDQRNIPTDLNLKYGHRASAALVWLSAIVACSLLVSSADWRTVLLLILSVAVTGVVALNWSFYRFLFVRRGLPFAVGGFVLHALYYAYASATFAWCWLCRKVHSVAQTCRRFGRPHAAPGASPR